MKVVVVGGVAGGMSFAARARPLWSDRILAKAQAATEEIRPGMDAGKRFAQMREAFDDALVTGPPTILQVIREQAVSPRHQEKQQTVAAARAGPEALLPHRE